MDKPFKEVIIDAIEHKGISIGKLAELSRVPERYVELIVRGEYEKLPSSPYLHGYLARLSETLNLEGELVWQVFKKEFDIRTSGEKDLLPKNRFAFEPINNTKVISISALVIFVFIYLVFRFNALFGKPYLVVLDPAESSISTDIETYVLKGNAEPENKLSINNELIDIKENGSFEKSVLLQEGVNAFEIKTKKFLGRETSVSRQIIFKKTGSSSPYKTENMNSATTTPSE
ncbi:MAG: helix-turn-helix domain-containing protein [Candidatus Paceibacterota bacterium]